MAMTGKCTYIDGIASSQAIDTAGEIVDIMGLDCSSLLGAAFNFEHKSDVPAQIVGKVLEFKKIFSEQDCESDRQKYYWEKVNMPFLYVLGRLFDDKKESSKEIAALFRDDAENPTEPKMVGFSIEGAKVNKEGMTITRSIARKVTITNMPANKTCIAEMIPAKRVSKNDPDSLFKGEIEFFNPTTKYLEILQKREKSMAKDVGSGGGAFIGSQMAMNELEKAAVPGSKYPSAAAAVGTKPLTTAGPPKFGPSTKGPSRAPIGAPKAGGIPKFGAINKALTAGSGMAAPAQLEGGAALGKEELDGKMKKAGFGIGGVGIISGRNMSSVPKEQTAGVSQSMNTTVGKSEKSKWLARAEEAYKTWEKREQFEQFMKSKMPHLTKGEIQAIGQTLALKKSIEAEKKMSKMFSSYFNKTTDVMMANEKKK